MRKTEVVVVCGIVAALAAGVVAGWCGPMADDDAALLQIPTVVAVFVLVAALYSQWVSLGSFVSVATFLALHTVASYFGYCNVPYEEWSSRLLGFQLSEVLGTDRNQFDRLLHFAYGLLLVAPARNVAARAMRVGDRGATWVAVEFVLASSLIYEIIEWLIALYMSPDVADRYNGQQGDLWDAQKDMALAALGAIISGAALPIFRVRAGRQ